MTTHHDTLQRSPHGVFVRSPHGVLDTAPRAPSPPVVGDVLFAIESGPWVSRSEYAGIFGAPAVEQRGVTGSVTVPRMQPEDFLQYGLIFNLTGGFGATLFEQFLPGLFDIGWKGRIHTQALHRISPAAQSISIGLAGWFHGRHTFHRFTHIHGIEVTFWQWGTPQPAALGNFADLTGHPLAEGTSGIMLEVPFLEDPREVNVVAWLDQSAIFTKAGKSITVESIVNGISFIGSLYSLPLLIDPSQHPSVAPYNRFFRNLYSVPVAS